MLPNPSWIGSALSDLLVGDPDRHRRPDYRQAFFLALAKVLGAAAWVDAPINQNEVNVIKTLLHDLSPRLTARELQRVARYLEESVPDEHFRELVSQLGRFTRRRARLRFAVTRLLALLAADGTPNQPEQELFERTCAILGWSGGDGGGDEEPPAASAPGRSHRVRTGLQLGRLTGQPDDAAPRSLLDRVRTATWERLQAGGGHETPPDKLYVLAATVAFLRGARVGNVGEDAELVGFTAAVSAVPDDVAEAALAAARQFPAAPAELPALAAELQRRTDATELGSLAQLLNAMADGEAALRRLRQLASPADRMAATIDHLVYGVPELEAGVALLREQFGVSAVYGGRHEGRGTHNALLGLGGDAYLEVIAPDPSQPSNPGGRRFLLEDLDRPRLITFAVRVRGLEQRRARAVSRGYDPGPVTAMSRRRPDGALLRWQLCRAPEPPFGGVVPFLIDWGATPSPAHSAPAGCRLDRLQVAHPDPDRVRQVLHAIDVTIPAERGPAPALHAELQTPRGRVMLR